MKLNIITTKMLVCALLVTAFACTKERPLTQNYTFGADNDHPALGNNEAHNGPVRDTGLIVMSGDRMEIKPSLLIKEERQVTEPRVQREDNNVCLQSGDVCVSSIPIFQRKCTDRSHFCIQCVLLLCLPWSCSTNVCEDVHVSDQCTAHENRCSLQENQWKEISTYEGLAPSTSIEDKEPMKSIEQLNSGLILRFSRKSGQSVDCPLGQFKPESSEEGFSFTLQNVEGCPAIFAKSFERTLSIVNQMNVPMSFTQGTQIRTWKEEILEQPQASTYVPSVEFLGSVSVFAKPSK